MLDERLIKLQIRVQLRTTRKKCTVNILLFLKIRGTMENIMKHEEYEIKISDTGKTSSWNFGG